MSLIFSKLWFSSKILWAYVLFDWSNLFFRSIESVLKCLKKHLSISINRNSWIRFLKNQSLTFQTYFQKGFQTFSLSPNWTRLAHNFCRFLPDFLQGFSLHKPVSPFCPSFWILFHVFMHFFRYFWNFSNWDFCWFKLLFLKLIIGFCSYNVIIMIYDD